MNSPKLCLQGDFLHQHYIDIWYRFLVTYANRCYFSFSFLTRLALKIFTFLHLQELVKKDAYWDYRDLFTATELKSSLVYQYYSFFSLTHDKPNNIQLMDDVLSDRLQRLEVQFLRGEFWSVADFINFPHTAPAQPARSCWLSFPVEFLIYFPHFIIGFHHELGRSASANQPHFHLDNLSIQTSKDPTFPSKFCYILLAIIASSLGWDARAKLPNSMWRTRPLCLSRFKFHRSVVIDMRDESADNEVGVFRFPASVTPEMGRCNRLTIDAFEHPLFSVNSLFIGVQICANICSVIAHVKESFRMHQSCDRCPAQFPIILRITWNLARWVQRW